MLAQLVIVGNFVRVAIASRRSVTVSQKIGETIARDRLRDRAARAAMTRSRYLPIALTAENNSVIAETALARP
jgi:hypothetical protein